MRGKYFGAAIGALKKVRQYWARKPRWEQDQLDLLAQYRKHNLHQQSLNRLQNQHL
jgi:hypothetical protein